MPVLVSEGSKKTEHFNLLAHSIPIFCLNIQSKPTSALNPLTHTKARHMIFSLNSRETVRECNKLPNSGPASHLFPLNEHSVCQSPSTLSQPTSLDSPATAHFYQTIQWRTKELWFHTSGILLLLNFLGIHTTHTYTYVVCAC